MITFGINNLYVDIAKNLLLENNNEHTTKQMITLLEVTLQRNYISFCNNIYEPEKCASMGSLISNTVAEIFLQDLENTHGADTRCTKHYLLRYVDDVLLIYNTKHTTPDIIHRHISKIHPNTQFTPTFEHNNSISFLDLLIIISQFLFGKGVEL